MYSIIRVLLIAIVFAALTAPTSAQDVSGTWRAVVELTTGSGEPTFVFEQDGDRITGTYAGTFLEADLTGTVTGNVIEFSFDVARDGGTATYTGAINEDTMKGTCDYGPVGSGTWEAERIE